GVISQSALGGAAGQAVLDPVACEDLGTAVVHAHGDADDDGTLGSTEAVQDALVDVDVLGSQVKLLAGHAKRGRVIVNWIAVGFWDAGGGRGDSRRRQKCLF